MVSLGEFWYLLELLHFLVTFLCSHSHIYMYLPTNNQNESIEMHFLQRQFEDCVIMLKVIIY